MAAGKYPDRYGSRNSNWRGGRSGACAQCGGSVWIRPSRMDRERHFCSKPCHYRWMSENTRRESGSAWTGGNISSSCNHCGKPFQISKGEKKRGGGKFCSRACFGLSRVTKSEISCQNCGKAFLVAKHQLASAKYCSASCRCEARKTTGERDVIKLRLDRRVSALVWYSLRKGSGKGGKSWKQLVPYSVDELRAHLARTMPAGYSWDDLLNGGLEIDHKIPRSAFNYTSPEDYDFRRCWALKNLQLLPALENNRKNAQLSEPFQPCLL